MEMTRPHQIASFVGHTRSGKRQLAAKLAVAIILRHRISFAIGLLLSLGAAVGVAAVFGSKSWEASGTMLYSPLIGSDSSGSLYVSPDMKTLVTLIKSRTTLEAIRNEFHLDVPLELLEKSYKVVVPSGTKTVDISLRWGKPAVASAMVNRLMELSRDQVAMMRKQKLQGFVESFEAHLEDCRRRGEAANASIERLFRRENVGQIAEEVDRLKREIAVLEGTFDTAQREVSNYQTQLGSIDRYIETLKSEDGKVDESARQAEAAQETLTDNRRRQERLRELIAEERLKLEVGVKLEARRQEMQRLSRLIDKHAASREQYEEARAEYLALESQIKETDRIRQWKDEIERIDKVVVPKPSAKSQGSTAIQQIVFKRLELQIQLDASRKAVEDSKLGIERRKRDLEHLKSLDVQHRSLTRAAEASDAERVSTMTQLSVMKQLLAIKTNEFTITTPAVTPKDSVSSNRKFLCVIVTGLGAVLTISLLALVDLVIWPPEDAEEATWKLGLPIFGRLSAVENLSLVDARQPENSDLRLLALRIRQAVPGYGSVILLSSLNESGGSGKLAAPLARCFASRDERVLILDLAGCEEDREVWAALRPPNAAPRDPQTEAAGLHTYLVFECEDPEDFLFPTRFPNVDCMPAGELLYGMEWIATNRMTALLELLKTRYSLILAIGPKASQQVDMEMLSSHAGGVIFHAKEGEPLCSPESVRVQHLISLGTPVLGAVLTKIRRYDDPRVTALTLDSDVFRL